MVHHDEETKAKARELAEAGATRVAISTELGVALGTLAGWLGTSKPASGANASTAKPANGGPAHRAKKEAPAEITAQLQPASTNGHNGDVSLFYQNDGEHLVSGSPEGVAAFLAALKRSP